MARRQQNRRKTTVPEIMKPLQHTCDPDKTLLTYKQTAFPELGYTITYCGVGGSNEDNLYLNNPTLQARIPRGFYVISRTSDNQILKVTHGCPKFFGQQDEDVMGLSETGFSPKVLFPGFTHEDLSATDSVFLYEKLNGKFAHFTFFIDPKSQHGTMCILTSKTAATIFPASELITPPTSQSDAPSGLLANMKAAFIRMWHAIPHTGRFNMVIAAYNNNLSFLMEYCDGLHMVPLPHGTQPYMVLTMVLKVEQDDPLDVSHSQVCHNIDGMHFTEWLRRECQIPDKFIVRYKQVDHTTWLAQTVNEFGTTNYFSSANSSDGIEGYVIHYVCQGEVMAIVKGKYNEYIIMRALREICKRPNPTQDSIVDAIRCKISGPGAYPSGLSLEEITSVCTMAQAFARWLLRFCAENKVTPRDLLGFCEDDVPDSDVRPLPLGMGQVWRTFMESNPEEQRFCIQDCFISERRSLILTSLPKLAVAPTMQPTVNEQTKAIFLESARTMVSVDVIPFITRTQTSPTESKMEVTQKGVGATWELTAYPASRDGRPTLVIMQAVPGSGKTTVVNLAVEQLEQLHGPGTAVVASADHYFEGRKFNPTELGFAHHACHVNAFTWAHSSSGCQFIFVDNTNCNLGESWRYVRFAADSDFNVVFWRITVTGDKSTVCKCLAARGIHLKDLGKLEGYWDKMMAGPIPATWDAYFRQFATTRISKVYGAAIDVRVPAKIRELVPESKLNGHVTLAFKNLHSSLYHPTWKKLPVTYLTIYERLEPNGIDAIACVAVKLPDEYMDIPGVRDVCQSHLHVTLYTKGKYEARQSADLVSGVMPATRVIDLSDGLSSQGTMSYY